MTDNENAGLVPANDTSQERAVTQGRLAKLSHKHLQIMEWLLANPQKPLKKCAEHFGITQPWLSSVINSDLFRAEYLARVDMLRQRHDLKLLDEMGGVITLGAEKMKEHLQSEDCTPETVNNYTKTALEALGYTGRNASRNAPKQDTNDVSVAMRFPVGDNEWAEAQAIIRNARGTT